jgi:prepilin-type N-terminal cleavage/methylation domain-containing protein
MFIKNKNKSNKGFTLIELLVVVAIISLLSSVLMASLTTARAKGRDSKRLRDVTEVRTALELYRSDFGGYPSTGSLGSWRAYCSAWNPGSIYTTTGASGYIPNLAPTYISVLPLDPKPTSSLCYLYTSDGTDYMFLVYGTVEGNIITSLRRPSNPTEKDYAIYTPGASGL